MTTHRTRSCGLALAAGDRRDRVATSRLSSMISSTVIVAAIIVS
jgi:hypothetical protein